jgi:hypothetical protein
MVILGGVADVATELIGAAIVEGLGVDEAIVPGNTQPVKAKIHKRAVKNSNKGLRGTNLAVIGIFSFSITHDNRLLLNSG